MEVDAEWSREERLRELAAVTDAALGRLGTDELLATLLDRVLEIVDADTTTVLLVDVEAGQLVARASRGVEEEVRQGVRVPIGAGFAGRIAREQRPLMIERVDATTVNNPILWERGIRVMLGVPMLAIGEVVGVLHVGRFEDRPFGPQDAEILSIAAERMAAAIQAEQRRDAQAAAAVLVRSLQPGPAPTCPGLDFASRYLPSERGGAGGDWYDVFVLPSGELWLVVGDAVGHGLPAAVVMGRTQTTLRAFASLGAAPEEVLDQVSRALQLFDPTALVTALCATTAAPYSEVRIATAGHPPPVLADPSAPATLVEMPVGPPLGLDTTEPRASTRLALPLGATLLFYTDGLVERRGESLDVSLERLRTSLSAGNPEDVCRQALRGMLGPDELSDDVAMIAVRRLDPTAT